MNNNEQGKPNTIKINRTYLLTPDSHTLFVHDPILHSISKLQRSPSKADRSWDEYTGLLEVDGLKVGIVVVDGIALGFREGKGEAIIEGASLGDQLGSVLG